MAAFSLSMATAMAGGIYPDDHWSHSSKITSQGDLDKLILENTAAGKTLFVRWIASAG